MNRPQKNPIRGRRRENGFALVVTLTLMILLSVLVVGLLSLASISLRTSSAGLSQAEARANARMALSLAIADLQKSMGPDQAASANASIVDSSSSEPNILGAWESYHWTPATSGTPSYSSKKDKFKRWLVSVPSRSSGTQTTMPSTALQDPVVMMSDPAEKNASSTYPEVSNSKKELRAAKVSYSDDTKKSYGAFAYAVIDESQKVPVQLDEETFKKGESIANRTAPQRAKPEILTADLAPSKISDYNKLISYDSTILASGESSGDYISENRNTLTPYSIGLLTDTANGGFKKDLTLLLEQGTVTDTIAVMGAKSPYGSTFANLAGVPLWDYFRYHYQLYKTSTINTSDGSPSYVPTTATDYKATSATTTAGLALTSSTTPTKERLIPVVSKLQLFFSIVSHNATIAISGQDRVAFYNQYGGGAGNADYMVPHLAVDPVITLYNPYNVTLKFNSSTANKLRIRIWDPPVLFAFKKNGNFFRSPMTANGAGFVNMAQLNSGSETSTTARKFFTLSLGGGTTESYASTSITLAPGESRVFAPRVQKAWNWGLETTGVSGGTTTSSYKSLAFFDYGVTSANGGLGNTDGRTANTGGLECINAWSPRAGLQFDHLAAVANRVAATYYSFENKSPAYPAGYVDIQKSDSFTVLSKAGRASTDATLATKPDFQVDVLVNNSTTSNYTTNLDTVSMTDVVRSYRFRFQDPSSEVEVASATSKAFNPLTKTIANFYQGNADPSQGKKSPFGVLTMSMKSTVGEYDTSKPWVYGNAAIEGAVQDSRFVGNALDTYDLNYKSINAFDSFPGGVSIDANGRGYYGANTDSQNGTTNVPMFDVPVLPAASLGDLINGNLVNTSLLPRVTYPLGNSKASPLLPVAAVYRSMTLANGNGSGSSAQPILDHSYLLNDALWDQCFFSTLLNYSTSSMLSGSDTADKLMEKFLSSDEKLLNRRLVPAPGTLGKAEDFNGLSNQEKSRQAAAYMAIKGPFNVNSTNVDAWKAMLMSAQSDTVTGWGGLSYDTKSKVAYPRFQLPIAGDSDSSSSQSSVAVAGAMRWAGFRTLTAEQITQLSTSIVEEIQKRGKEDSAPSETVGEFVNRRLSTSGVHSLQGLLETAIENSKINSSIYTDSYINKEISTSTYLPTGMSSNVITGAVNTARAGHTAEGSPAVVTQGDLMKALAPVITVRGDTFVVRAYGESRNVKGEVIAKAWCEAVVQRVPQYVDSTDEAKTAVADLKSESNKKFGRRFEVLAFRWLSPKEV